MPSVEFSVLELRVITAVLFDFGGVFTSSPFEAFAAYERARGLPENFIRGINATNPHDNAWARFERAEINLDQFDHAFAAEARARGHDVRGRDVVSLLSGELRTNMVSALRRIKEAGFKTGCITNNVPGLGADAPEDGGLYRRDVMQLFDAVLESSKLGLRKPDPRIYLRMCEVLEVEPAHCIYLDDLGINLKPARELGMTTIKVDTAEPAIRSLSTLLGLALET
ncbi:MAG: HAD-IA family hydrolase [Alphaproteobacteria bacterium]|nr:HAD-IA family hydrolase [Alphaproteobacteria bacterium]